MSPDRHDPQELAHILSHLEPEPSDDGVGFEDPPTPYQLQQRRIRETRQRAQELLARAQALRAAREGR